MQLLAPAVKGSEQVSGEEQTLLPQQEPQSEGQFEQVSPSATSQVTGVAPQQLPQSWGQFWQDSVPTEHKASPQEAGQSAGQVAKVSLKLQNVSPQQEPQSAEQEEQVSEIAAVQLPSPQ